MGSQAFWESLAQESRVNRVSRMIPSSGPIPDAIAQEITSRAESFLKEFGIAQVDLARDLGTSQNFVSSLLNGGSAMSPATREKLLRGLNQWMEMKVRERLAARPENFIELRTARKIIDAAKNIVALRAIGIVDGPAGVGKTLTAQYLASELPGTMLVSIDPESRNYRGLLAKIHAASRLRRDQRYNPRLSDVVERLRGTSRLLIVDQAHDLVNINSFKLLMALHDQCELPIMLLGTIDIHRQLRDDTDPNFGQLSSRIGLRVHLIDEIVRRGSGGRQLQWVSSAELRKIFEGEKLRFHADALRALTHIANFEVGHLRRVKWLTRYAEAIARAEKCGEILLRHVETAIELVAGEQRPLAAWRSIPAEAAEAG